MDIGSLGRLTSNVHSYIHEHYEPTLAIITLYIPEMTENCTQIESSKG